eukprot:6667373-Pyramimonas_sp.AAC.1
MLRGHDAQSTDCDHVRQTVSQGAAAEGRNIQAQGGAQRQGQKADRARLRAVGELAGGSKQDKTAGEAGGTPYIYK